MLKTLAIFKNNCKTTSIRNLWNNFLRNKNTRKTWNIFKVVVP